MAEEATQSKEQGVRPPGDVNPRLEPVLDFADKAFEDMTPGDYDALGFMSGIEVHQQLRTKSKLFCRCPSGRRVTRVDAEVLRHMRPTLSELGEYDGTALMEFKTKKEIVYLLERGSMCTYETDDTPPFEIDDESVRIAIEIAKLCDLNLVSELHVMRKQYLDGSIPTGFQRTAMVGLTGTIPFCVPELGVDRDLRIRQLSLEEDSCREVSDVGHRITFRTDRLGMALTEVVTEPEFLTPFELQAGARLVAHIAQATGKVQRGPGAARQDVNVSIAGGRRVEIKGVHHHRRLPRLVHTEAFRQLSLLRIKAELERRGTTRESFGIAATGLPWEISPLVMDARSVMGQSNHAPLREAIDRGEFACAIRLPGYGGLLIHQTQPGITYAQEIGERVRVIACPVHRPFMTHSDLEDSGVGEQLWGELSRALQADSGDAILVVWAEEHDAATAAREVLIRARETLEGIPAETRQAFADGTTGFERILPGPDRMYPDTDTPPLPIADSTIAEVCDRLPETPWARQDRYEGMGLDRRTACRLAVSSWADLFDQLAPQSGAPAQRLATTLEKRIPFNARRNGKMPTAERLAPVIQAFEQGALRPEAFERALDVTIRQPDREISALLVTYQAQPGDGERLEGLVADVAGRAHTLAGKRPDAVMRWAMGEVMTHFLGRVAPTTVRERLGAALAVATEVGS